MAEKDKTESGAPTFTRREVLAGLGAAAVTAFAPKGAFAARTPRAKEPIRSPGEMARADQYKGEMLKDMTSFDSTVNCSWTGMALLTALEGRSWMPNIDEGQMTTQQVMRS